MFFCALHLSSGRNCMFTFVTSPHGLPHGKRDDKRLLMPHHFSHQVCDTHIISICISVTALIKTYYLSVFCTLFLPKFPFFITVARLAKPLAISESRLAILISICLSWVPISIYFSAPLLSNEAICKSST